MFNTLQPHHGKTESIKYITATPMGENMNEIILKVAEAPPMDIGLGRARLDSKSREKLNVEIGDVIEITGKRTTAARVFKAKQEDEDRGIIRIDAYIRKNAKVEVGDEVKVKKANPEEAMKIVLAPLIGKNQRLMVSEDIGEFVKRSMLKRPLIEGNEIVVPNLTLSGRESMLFKVVKTVPAKKVLQIGANTEIEVREEPPNELIKEDVGKEGKINSVDVVLYDAHYQKIIAKDGSMDLLTFMNNVRDKADTVVFDFKRGVCIVFWKTSNIK